MNNFKSITVFSLMLISGCSATPEKKVEDFISVDVCQFEDIKQDSGVVFADLSGDWSTREYYDKENKTCFRKDTALAEAQIKLYQYKKEQESEK